MLEFLPKKTVKILSNAVPLVKPHIASSIAEVRKYRALFNDIGFVPTMGALHDGHLSLIKKAKEDHQHVFVSIFVNPTQFGVGEDFDKYPRKLEDDIKLLHSMGVDCVFTPSNEEMYPRGDENVLCHVEPLPFQKICEGISRPNFFRGVATVVCKLFNIISPNTSYFGQKDISQGILLQRMVQDLNMPFNVKICNTIRESDGLAMSSRNVYLSSEERKAASILFKALTALKEACESSDEADGKSVSNKYLVKLFHTILQSEPLVTRIEYISIGSHNNMMEISQYDGKVGAVASAAIRVGNVRLIDNVLIGPAYHSILN